MEYKDLKELYDHCTYCQAKMNLKKQYIEGDLVLNLPKNPVSLYNLLKGTINNLKINKNKEHDPKNAKNSKATDDDF